MNTENTSYNKEKNATGDYDSLYTMDNTINPHENYREKQHYTRHVLLASLGIPVFLFALFAVSILISMFIMAANTNAIQNPEQLEQLMMNPTIVTVMLVAQSIIMLLIAIFATFVAGGKKTPKIFQLSSYKNIFTKLGFVKHSALKTANHIVTGLLIGLVVFAALQVIVILFGMAGISLDSSDTSEMVFSSNSWILVYLMTPLIVPIVEEVFFRGFILGFFSYPDFSIKKRNII